MRGLSAVLFGLACNYAARGEVPGTSEVRYLYLIHQDEVPHKQCSRERQTTMLVFDVGWKAVGISVSINISIGGGGSARRRSYFVLY